MNAGKQALIIGTIGVLLGILAPEIVNWIKEWTAGG